MTTRNTKIIFYQFGNPKLKEHVLLPIVWAKHNSTGQILSISLKSKGQDRSHRQKVEERSLPKTTVSY